MDNNEKNIQETNSNEMNSRKKDIQKINSNEINSQELLGTEKIWKLLIKYSIPAIVGMLVTSLYNIVDRAFIGSIPGVGPLAIAGLGVTMPVFTLILAFGMLIAMGAMTAVTSISLMFMMPIFGINQGAQSIIGYNYGAKKYDRSKQAVILSIAVATIILVIGFVIIQLFPRFFVGIFNKDKELMDIGVQGIRIYLATLPIIGISIVGPVYFQSIGKAKYSMFLTLLRQFILLAPLILILPKYFGLAGVWLSQPVADIISAIVIVVILMKDFKKSSE